MVMSMTMMMMMTMMMSEMLTTSLGAWGYVHSIFSGFVEVCGPNLTPRIYTHGNAHPDPDESNML